MVPGTVGRWTWDARRTTLSGNLEQAIPVKGENVDLK